MDGVGKEECKQLPSTIIIVNGEEPRRSWRCLFFMNPLLLPLVSLLPHQHDSQLVGHGQRLDFNIQNQQVFHFPLSMGKETEELCVGVCSDASDKRHEGETEDGKRLSKRRGGTCLVCSCIQYVEP